MDTAEQCAVDLVAVLAQRPDGLLVARSVLKGLAELKGRAQCAVCGRDFKRHCSSKLYCGKKCRERRKYLAQRAELAVHDYRACPQQVVGCAPASLQRVHSALPHARRSQERHL